VSDFALPRHKGPSVASWGMAMFIGSETALFAMMIGSYFYIRFKNLAWPPRGIEEPKVVVPLILLGVLLASSVPMVLGALAARDGRVRTARTAYRTLAHWPNLRASHRSFTGVVLPRLVRSALTAQRRSSCQ